VTDVQDTSTTVPPGYATYNGHYYRFVLGDFTHAQAEAGAAAAGGYLATITSAGENAVLAELMAASNTGGYGGWLGGSDAGAEGTWTWTGGSEAGTTFWNGLSDGSAAVSAYTNWLPGQPDQYRGVEEDYLHMLTGTDRWNDIPNDSWFTMGYFVEVDGGGAPSGSPPSITSNGGGLSATLNVAENTRAVTTVVASDADTTTLTYSIAGGADAALFEINGNTGALSFTTAPNYEAPTDTGANNVYDVLVRASDGSNTDTQALSITVADVQDTSTTVPPGYATYNGHYYRYEKGLYTHAQAEAGAAAAGGYLGTITSAGENAVVAALIAGQDLGGWLGASDSRTEETWLWTQGPEGGSPLGYTNWAPGEPTGQYRGVEEDYVHMMANDSRWNDAPEYWVTMGYIVEIG
jgi:hypothetical protein